MSAQATLLTGTLPREHGVVGNGWLFRDTGEIRFWQQARTLLQGETVYDEAKRRDPAFTCANVFGWFNQGAAFDWAVTPKPWYGCDGNKIFGIHGHPNGYPAWLEQQLGIFPFQTFWGPMAGEACTHWITDATVLTLGEHRPNLTITYLPQMDYDLQRYGPDSPQAHTALRVLDDCIRRIVETAQTLEIEIILVSEYGIAPVHTPVHINQILRDAGLLVVRDGPFGETIDPFQSTAFAVADHQIAHVYSNDPEQLRAIRERLAQVEGVAKVWGEAEKHANSLDHPRSGDLVAIAAPDAWFTYYYWRDERRAPDFAKTIDIHRKPGYDPCELFFDPSLIWPGFQVGWRLLQKKLGFRTRFDLIPLDATLVRGSHGLHASDPLDGPVFLSTAGNAPNSVAMTDVKPYLLNILELTP